MLMKTTRIYLNDIEYKIIKKIRLSFIIIRFIFNVIKFSYL